MATPTLRLTETTRPPAPLTAALAASTDAPRSRSTTKVCLSVSRPAAPAVSGTISAMAPRIARAAALRTAPNLPSRFTKKGIPRRRRRYASAQVGWRHGSGPRDRRQSGIGRETARQLVERGYDVVLSARDEAKAREAAEAVGARPLVLDVSDPASIERAAAEVTEDPGRLDVLVNNAGVGTDWGVAGVDPDFGAIQTALDTNFFGAYRLTVALLPLLRASEHPRVVNVSSGMGGITEMGGWSPGYRVSKAALNAMTRILSTELAEAGVLVNSACPGFVATDMGGQFGADQARRGRRGRHRLARHAPGRRPHRRVLPRRQAASRSRAARKGSVRTRPSRVLRHRPQASASAASARRRTLRSSTGDACRARSRRSFQVMPSRTRAGMPIASAVAISTAWRMIP